MSSIASPHPQGNRQRTLSLAWATLIVSFCVACLILCASGYLIWSYRIHAMSLKHGVLILRAPPEWVNVQRRGYTIFEQARNEQLLDEGYRVSIDALAGYGQSTTIRLFDQSTIDMWAGSDLLLKTLQTSRWNTRKQLVELQQRDGYVRYDLKDDQPYDQICFRIFVANAYVELAPGGSYSIGIQPSNRRLLFVDDEAYDPPIVDVAVRSGSAVVYGSDQTVALVAGQRLVIDPVGNLSEPQRAFWNLVRDGDFSAYSEQEYNNTTIPSDVAIPRAQTWQVFSGATETGASGGFFRLAQGCPPPNMSSDCMLEEQIKAAWFIRGSNQTTNFTTGVIQVLGPEREGIDISEYRSLAFSVWVRILNQSLELAGERGTECPIMIRFVSKENSPRDPEQERVICVYTSEIPPQEMGRSPGIRYYRTEQYEWFHLRIELRNPDWLPDAHYLRSIEIYANGHDYDSRATMVSLVGSHYPTGSFP